MAARRSALIVQRVFPRAWHLLTEDGFVVSVACTNHDGPLGIRLERKHLEELPVRPGMRAVLCDGDLVVDSVRVSLRDAEGWRPRLPLTPSPSPSRGEGSLGAKHRGEDQHCRPRCAPRHRYRPVSDSPSRLEREGSLCWEYSDEDERHGVGTLLFTTTIRPQTPPLPGHRGPGLRERGPGGEGYAALLGLGPGLTPSGDDFLCGLMAGLRILGSRAGRDTSPILDPLRGTIDRLALSRTTALSRTLLYYAGRGTVVAPLEAVLFSLGNKRVEGVDRLLAIGHSSGRDMLAGALHAAGMILGGEAGDGVFAKRS